LLTRSIPQLRPEASTAEADARMTKEQLGELAEALSILSAKSSIVKERDELKQLMEDNITSEEVSSVVSEEHIHGY
jgi:LETM1 and EF-hand domain-containing protein 1, mitochondrial